MTSHRTSTILAVAVSTIVLAAVGTALVLLDPPAVQRQRRIDARRVEDLVAIQRAVEVYWKQHGALPRNLATLASEPGLLVPRGDPATAKPYEYEVTGTRTYRICAYFERDTAERDVLAEQGSEWAHGAGRHCFERTIPKVDVVPIRPQ